MKKFTLLALSAAIATMPVVGMAQVQSTQTAKVAKARQIVCKTFGQKGKKILQKTEANEKKMLPGTVKTYQYNSNDFEYLSTTENTYNQHGNIILSKQYNENTNGTIEVITNVYDDIEPDFLISQKQEIFDSPGSTTPSSSRTLQKSDVTRDAKGQVTEVINYEPNDDFSELEMESKITFEYKNNKINNIVYYGYDEGIETKISIINIIWEKYNGKILSAFGKAIDDIVYDPENLIKLASMELMSEDIYVPGSAVGTYTGETKRKLDVDFNFYGTPIAQFIYEYNQTDNNESYTYTSEAKSMGKQIYLLTFTNKFNEKKDLIEKTEKEDIADEEGGMTSYEESSKYEYSYNESTGLADYAIVNSLNTDNNQYETTLKLVFSDYKEVTAGISNAAANVNTGKTAVYNTQGMYVGNSTDKLSDGLYIIKQDGKTFKMMK